ncbi:hypothetical protein FG386_000794 [Cryptosporidium ryanae]|uniref:uncharacterized protein n=1 Tax=Cryptosporidium ryanae TaxID=515981 RepID=UPI00351A36E9|nr:hypothetical protein FG386_000794 [Cryptosporidium ryanae]
MQYVDSFSSRQLFDLVKSIGECRSKYEEDNIIMNELTMLQLKMQEHSISSVRLREYMIRAIYIEMLGHDASFAYIHAIKMTNEKNALAKRIGYLACCIFFNRDNELIVLLINTLQRDLSSRNQLDIISALSSLPYLLNTEILSSIEELLVKLLSHQTPIIRRKTYLLFLKVIELKPTIIDENNDLLRRGLCDIDIGVVNSTLCLVDKINTYHPKLCLSLIPYMIANLKQVIENNIPKGYEYHCVPAPWTQIKVLEILSDLVVFDKNVADQIYEIIYNTTKKVELSISMPAYNGKSMVFSSLNPNIKSVNNSCNISFAIFDSCTKAITSINTKRDLLDQITEIVSKLLNSGVNYLKYIGIKCLTKITKIDPSYAIPHQMVVIDCLEDKDETLRRCTLDLLCKMTNPQNIEFVISKLIRNLISSKDSHFRDDLVKNIILLSEMFSPTYSWYLNTMIKLFELSGDNIGRNKANNVAQIIAEGPTGDELEDSKFRNEATTIFSRILENNLDKSPETLCNLAIWVIGEYGSIDPSGICDIKSLEVIYNSTRLLSKTFMYFKGSLKLFQNDIKTFNKEPELDLSNVKVQTSWETISIIISAIMKCYSNAILVSNKVTNSKIEEKEMYLNKMNNIYNDIISECLKYPLSLISQRNSEFISLLLLNKEFKNSHPNISDDKFFNLLSFILPYDASCEEISVDKNLLFLDNFVNEYRLSNEYLSKINKTNLSRKKTKNEATANSIDFIENFSDSNQKSTPIVQLGHTNQKSENFNEFVSEIMPRATQYFCNVDKSERKFHEKSQTIKSNGKYFLQSEIISKQPKTFISTSTNKWGPEGYKTSRKPENSVSSKYEKIDNYENIRSKEVREKDVKKQKEVIALFSGIYQTNRNN